MIDATAIIMTKNEEKNIVDCLKSMDGFAKRCVVIDCGSTDRTVELAKEFSTPLYVFDENEIRKNLLEYDQVMNEQREVIYEERRRVLNGESMRDAIFKMITDIVESKVDISINEENRGFQIATLIWDGGAGC